jgi:mRNA interferase RelE/StbE
VRVAYEASFARDLKNIRDGLALRQVQRVIEEIKAAERLDEIRNLTKLRGYVNAYRIRLGEYRIGIESDGEQVVLVRILHRKDIYRYFP